MKAHQWHWIAAGFVLVAGLMLGGCGGHESMTPATLETESTKAALGRMAFASTRAGQYEIYLQYSSPAIPPVRLTNNSVFDANPDLSPGGGAVAYITASDATGQWDIYTVKVNGTNRTRLTTSPLDDATPAWSPHGTKIAFVHGNRPKQSVWVMSASGTGKVRLTKDLASCWRVTWSPDGKRIAFGANNQGGQDIWVVNADGTGLKRIVDLPGHNTEPDWSPDGKRIVFSSDRGNPEWQYSIWIMDADGTHVRRLTTGTDTRWASWCPDGTRIAFQRSGAGVLTIYSIKPDKTGLRIEVPGSERNAQPSWWVPTS